MYVDLFLRYQGNQFDEHGFRKVEYISRTVATSIVASVKNVTREEVSKCGLLKYDIRNLFLNIVRRYIIMVTGHQLSPELRNLFS